MKTFRRTGGFTLVELLVVIGIIALLISILLPALTRARAAAQAIACSANLRSILQAMQIFAAQNNGQIPGSPYTTARFLWAPGTRDVINDKRNNNFGAGPGGCPTIIQIFDWMSPLAKVMGVRFNENGAVTDRKERWLQLKDAGQFRCPSNDIIGTPYSGSDVTFPAGRTISYCVPMSFLVQASGQGGVGETAGVNVDPGFWKLPTTFNNKTNKVGDASRKVFVADGSKYATPTQQPDADLSIFGSYGGAFADQGMPSTFSRAWCRTMASGNGGTGTWDPRVWFARHGGPKGKGPNKGGTFKMNVGFFDGHAETMDDLAASDPRFWYPKGTVVPSPQTEFCADTKTAFGIQATNYIVP